MTKKKLILVLSRDFSLWTNQMIRNIYVSKLPQVWGRGLRDQIVYYTGRIFQWYRYEDDLKLLEKHVTNKAIDDPLFQDEIHTRFRGDVAHLREYLSVLHTNITDSVFHLKNIRETFTAMYPIYTLSFFLGGAWRDKFLSIHGKAGESVLEIIFRSREYSEGLLNNCDKFLKEWLGPILVKNGYPNNYLKLLSIEEIDNLVKNNILPSHNILEERAKGFIYMDDEIMPVSNFDKFLEEKNLYIEDINYEKELSELKGMVACKGGKVAGKVQTIFNSDEALDFPSGAILVTPMTSPLYLQAIKNAKAIITDEGGATCHAAIIAREMNIPCVIGTKMATKILRDGDLVEVYADKGIIRKLK